jgi:glycosyltransferase involved in cell wall biosynthesis
VPAVVLPNGTRLPAPPNGAPKEFDVLYAGSLLRWKGVETIVAAMAHLAPYRLTLLGGRVESERKALQDFAAGIGCADRITFLPPVPSAEVWSFYARARVGVVPLNPAFLEAREFTCPVKLMEMMGAGLPVVCARLPSIQEFVVEEQDVLMAKSDDPVEFAAGIRRLLEEPGLAARLAASARTKAEEHSFERRAERFLSALEAAGAGIAPSTSRGLLSGD